MKFFRCTGFYYYYPYSSLEPNESTDDKAFVFEGQLFAVQGLWELPGNGNNIYDEYFEEFSLR